MTKKIKILYEYLYLPVQIEKEERRIEVFCLEDNQEIKIMEFMISVGIDTEGAYSYDYLARFPVKQFTDKTLILKGDVPEAFMKEVSNTSFIAYKPLRRPSIHFTAERGWINDPNGLVYKNGRYHLYFQYNPFNTVWNNMSWGHAESEDLLHWEQKETVLLPDEDGMIFSGCGLVNEKGMFDLPKEAILYFYTAAGGTNLWGKDKLSTQKVAYSLDDGETLIKTDIGKLETICKENRDPKIFWHEESLAYIMCLWLEGNDFAILRSVDLKEWSITDRLTLEKAWECPDLVKIPTEDGRGKWLFWSADGFYYWGEFDGYRFFTDGRRHTAYINKLPYAAQTYSGIKDRVVSVSWIRSRQEGRLFTGTMGLPRELSAVSCNGEVLLSQQPIKELKEYSVLIYDKETEKRENNLYQLIQKNGAAFIINMEIKKVAQAITMWSISGIIVSYEKETGILRMGEENYEIGKEIYDFSFIIDETILEVSANCGIILGVYELTESETLLEADTGQFECFQVYKID